MMAKTKPPPSGPGRIVVAKHERWSEGLQEEIHQEWRTKEAADFKVRCVCGPCNEGWMSAIESNARPSVGAMMRGEVLTLSNADQEKVANWLGLKAIIAQHSVPTAHIVPGWTRAFASKQCPPTSWQIRIASHHDGASIFMSWTSVDAYIASRLMPQGRRSPGFIVIIRLGHFVGQVVGLPQETRILPAPHRFVQIWPHPLLRAESPDISNLQGVSWPPPDGGLDDSDMRKCARDASEPRL
jgi:hypothetical protein